MTTAITNATLIDGTGADPVPQRNHRSSRTSGSRRPARTSPCRRTPR